MYTYDIWDPKWASLSKIFIPLLVAEQYFSKFVIWPTLGELNKYAKNSSSVTFVAQTPKNQISSFASSYEPRIYLQREVQTRLHNWHDFFNALVWSEFPKIKTLLNKLQYTNLSMRRANNLNQRTKIENILTHFDECGIIISSKDPYFFQLIKSHKWEQLFYEHRHDFHKNVQCTVFGHAIFEKALSPYIGLTAKAILLEDYDGILTDNESIDATISKLDFTNIKLYPVPILGIPNWYHQQDREFYLNQRYFRACS